MARDYADAVLIMTDIRQSLLSLPLLAPLSPSFLDRLAECSAIRVIRRGETIFCQGEPSPYCFGILSGAVSLQKVSTDRRYSSKLLRTLVRGDIFGESALFTDSPRSAMASASEPGELLTIQGKKFRDGIQSDPAAGVPLLMGLLNSSLGRLRHTSQELSVIYGVSRTLSSAHPLDYRLAGAIDFMKSAIEGVDDGLLLLRDASSGLFKSLPAPHGKWPTPALLPDTPLIEFAQTLENVTILEGPRLRSLLDEGFLPWKAPEALILIPLLDRTLIDKPLTGVLILHGERSPFFLSDLLQLLSAVGLPLSEAVARQPISSAFVAPSSLR